MNYGNFELGSKNREILLEGSLENICSATVIYLTIEGDILSEYNTIRDLTDSAVTSALLKINDYSRKLKVLEVLPQNKNEASIVHRTNLEEIFCAKLTYILFFVDEIWI
ncbi:8690_t:CDS:2 [Funneliformis caledonium]|uniref:8690_t:CDS:1 n=1 Tax=Funneliformis caledonium TaxID=1117310 RepID=A0A9N8VC74_9GLOM|nr:8690_t:CDS:2 [Funneliformis caledonium]